MSRNVTIYDLPVDDFNRFRAEVKRHPHERAAGRAVFEAGLDALAAKASPVDVTTDATPVTPEDAPVQLAPAKKKAGLKKAPAKRRG